MKIVIPGGSGHVGRILARAFGRDGHEVVILSRRDPAEFAGPPGRFVRWEGRAPGAWTAELEDADVVINLAGRSVDCRYHAANRRAILDSRLDSVRAVSQAVQCARRPPRLWLQAATATIYAHSFDVPNDEVSGRIGGTEPDAPAAWRFSIEVAQAWEREFEAATLPETRRVALRSAMIMSPDVGGVFHRLLQLTRLGLGGRAGHGRQYVSWIHEHDFVHAVFYLIDNKSLSGPVNLASPNPLPNAEFMRALRQAAGVPVGLPSARWMLEVGALFLRTETELLLKSRRVVPGRLLDAGFEFRFPDWPRAARDLCWRSTGHPAHRRSRLLALDS